MNARIRTWLMIASLAAAALLLAGCGGSATVQPSAKAAAPPSCPNTWRAGWQRLADQVGAPVFCPSWMPSPLDARIGGEYANGRSVSKDRSYLVSFVSLEHDVGGISAEVHINFRGYPGRTAIPACQDTITENGVTKRTTIPCFADKRWTKTIGATRVSAYTANQGADQWHVLYAWRRAGTLYALSEHVAPPYTFRQVVANLNRMMRGLVLVRPAR
jgi:hypothetical protein